MLTCFSFASEKQESTVYSATGRLLFSTRYGFFASWTSARLPVGASYRETLTAAFFWQLSEAQLQAWEQQVQGAITQPVHLPFGCAAMQAPGQRFCLLIKKNKKQPKHWPGYPSTKGTPSLLRYSTRTTTLASQRCIIHTDTGHIRSKNIQDTSLDTSIYIK